jgi:hypothetical protein
VTVRIIGIEMAEGRIPESVAGAVAALDRSGAGRIHRSKIERALGVGPLGDGSRKRRRTWW